MFRETVEKKLNNVVGVKKAPTVFADICQEIGVDDLASADDSLKFGNALIARGGLFESIGRSIKIQAILFGAVEARPS